MLRSSSAAVLASLRIGARRGMMDSFLGKRGKSTKVNGDGSSGTHASVQEYYGKILNTTKDLKTSACTTSNAPMSAVKEALKLVPTPIIEKYYGCGSPLPMGIEGLSVLDLGSGSGRDCYVASKLVGEHGRVIGIDMTDEQLDVARAHMDSYAKTLGYKNTNMSFVKGYIENLREAGIEDESIDLVLSNCVVNLSPDKEAVIKGVYDCLRIGGEFYFSDVYADRRLPEEVRKNDVLWGECISGALYVQDFKRICAKVGFNDVRVLETSPVHVTDPQLKEIVGEAKFCSITYRCFKLPQLETLCEDYGQVAYYKGTIPEHRHKYVLDDHHLFETNRPVLVCGNTASMLSESWLAPHFTVVGDRSVHYGLFDCGPPNNALSTSDEAQLGGILAQDGACC